MKVIMISSVPALPTDAGNRARIRALAEEVMALGHELTFVLLPVDRRPHDVALHLSHFQGLHPRAKVVSLSNGGTLGNRWYRFLRSIRKGWRKLVRRLGYGTGFYSGLDQFWNPLWDGQIRDLCADAEVVLVEYAFNTRAFRACPADARKILDTHDVLADRHITYREKGLGRSYWVSLRPEDELAAFQRADTILAIQAAEARGFRDRLDAIGDTSTDVSVVSHFPTVAAAPLGSGTSTSGLFVASDNPSNRESLKVFLERVLPLVRQRLPDFRMVVAGSICRNLPEHEGLEKVGVVEDLTSVYGDAAMSINPMQVGTGINIKLLDAMSNGLPVVTTETGARGLEPDQRGGLLVSEDDNHEAFASHIVKLVEDRMLRTDLGNDALAASRNWVRTQREKLAMAIGHD